MSEKKYPSSVKKMTICICPRCRKEHESKLFWTGNGTPRIYCHHCKFHSIVNEIIEYDPHSLSRDVRLST